jgi:hypothetical protein
VAGRGSGRVEDAKRPRPRGEGAPRFSFLVHSWATRLRIDASCKGCNRLQWRRRAPVIRALGCRSVS